MKGIGKTILLLLLSCGCSYRSKWLCNDLCTDTCAEMLCDQFSRDQIELDQLDMEVLKCNQWRIFYKIFRRDGCVVSVWETNGSVPEIRIEPYSSSGAIMHYVLNMRDGSYRYVKPECAIKVLDSHVHDCRLESVLGVKEANDALSFSRRKFGDPNANSVCCGKSHLYYFNIVGRENISATLTIFSGGSWLIQLHRKSN